MNDFTVTEPGVLRLVRALRVGKASGNDNISTRPLKECAASISGVITFIFSQSLSSDQLSSDWKSANIMPVFKNGAADKPENYRPVSLTSVLSKLMEQIIYSQI